MPNRAQIHEQIRNITYEIHYYVNLLYMIPCVYTRNAILNLIRDRLCFLNLMINQLNNESSIAGTDTTTTTALPDSISSMKDSTPSSTLSGVEQLTLGIQPSSLQNIASVPTQNDQGNQATFTTEQLSRYTGKNGAPAYVAVNGVVYDVTNNAAWAAATHFGLVAGRDLTQEFASCHAGANILQKLRVVGRLVP